MRRTVAFLVLLIASARASAQDAKLAGTWKLDTGQSQGLAPGLQLSLAIRETGDTAIVDTRVTTPQGPVVLSDTILLTGVEFPYTYRRANGKPPDHSHSDPYRHAGGDHAGRFQLGRGRARAGTVHPGHRRARRDAAVRVRMAAMDTGRRAGRGRGDGVAAATPHLQTAVDGRHHRRRTPRPARPATHHEVSFPQFFGHLRLGG